MNSTEFWALPTGEAKGAAWVKMTQAQREAVRKLPTWHELWEHKGKRVEVIDQRGEKRRFWVGLSTGWEPCLLEVKTTRSLLGDPCDASYREFRVIKNERSQR